MEKLKEAQQRALGWLELEHLTCKGKLMTLGLITPEKERLGGVLTAALSNDEEDIKMRDSGKSMSL